MDNSITLRNISKSFKKNKVLRQISVEFANGKIHGIIGYNGSGKTVLLKIICGLIPADDGELYIGG